MLARAAPALREVLLLDARLPRVETIWRALEAAARPPYFLTWGWVENWLASLPRDEAPVLAVLRCDNEPAAAFFLGRPRVVSEPLFSRRAIYFNVTGLAHRDELCLEHNALICLPSLRCSLAELVARIPGDWDELDLPALTREAFPGRALGEPLPRHRVVVDAEKPAPFVDLARVRAAPGGYLSLLGSSTRAHIRRARRGFGALTVEAAGDRLQALAFFDELSGLHAAHWRDRGQTGAFADPWIDRFHRRLIARRFDAGEIQLLRVRAGGATIGILYNLVAYGRVLFYQSGLATYADPHLRPGYVCHAAAVEHNALAGHALYDFLGGTARYKRDLATDTAQLTWARIQRPLARFALEERLRRWHRALAR